MYLIVAVVRCCANKTFHISCSYSKTWSPKVWGDQRNLINLSEEKRKIWWHSALYNLEFQIQLDLQRHTMSLGTSSLETVHVDRRGVTTTSYTNSGSCRLRRSSPLFCTTVLHSLFSLSVSFRNMGGVVGSLDVGWCTHIVGKLALRLRRIF